jgi:hypothetical protein
MGVVVMAVVLVRVDDVMVSVDDVMVAVVGVCT